MMMWEIGEMLIASVGKQFVLHLGRIRIPEEDFWGALGSGYDTFTDFSGFMFSGFHFSWVLILSFQNV